jgi:hypothetical protein
MSGKVARLLGGLVSDQALIAGGRVAADPLAVLGDDALAVGELPPPGDAFWQHAGESAVYRPRKVSTTVRIDADVLLWLRGDGKGYQSRLNGILREAMLAALGC